MEHQRVTKAAQKEQPKAPSSSLRQTSLNHLGVHPLLELQRTIGNQAVLNMLHSQNTHIDASTQALREPRFGHDFSRIPIHFTQAAVPQTKLQVNQPGDVYEQEADRVAEQVMRMTDVESPISNDEEEAKNALMRKQVSESGADAATQYPDVSPIVHDVLNGGEGQPLDTTTRAFMEPRFGHDFSQVRVHTDDRASASARAVNALAYTVGRDIVFDKGQYAPGTSNGRRLLAHELTHAVQQIPSHQASSLIKENAPSAFIQRYVSPLDILDYIGLGYDVAERIYLAHFYEGSDKEFQLFLNLFFTALDLAMAALPGIGGGGLVARGSRKALAIGWDTLPSSAKAKLIEKVSKEMAWTTAKTLQVIHLLMMAGKGNGSGGSEEGAQGKEGETEASASSERKVGPSKTPSVDREFYDLDEAASAALREEATITAEYGPMKNPRVKKPEVRAELEARGYNPDEFLAVQYEATTKSGKSYIITVFEAEGGVYFGPHLSSANW